MPRYHKSRQYLISDTARSVTYVAARQNVFTVMKNGPFVTCLPTGRLDAMAKATHTDYQKFQYFFPACACTHADRSDSTWDIQALKRKRLEIIQNQRTTASTKDGLLAIDDTGCPKPFAKKTEGAKWQYCGPLKREEVCNVGVGIAFVSPAKHFPIDIIPYLPSSEFPGGETNPLFKDKIRIAKELFDISLETMEFSAVTFDSWYAATHFLLF